MGTMTRSADAINGATNDIGFEPVLPLDWRERAVRAALRAHIHSGEGGAELLRQIRGARPDATTVIINVERDGLVSLLKQRGHNFAELIPSTEIWDHDEDSGSYCVGWFACEWEGSSIEVALTPSTNPFGVEICLGADVAIVRRLAKELSDEAIRPAGRCLRFTQSWEKARDLDVEVARTTWDDVVLPEALSGQIRESADGFFAHRDVYRSMGFAWRRGLLMVGPPGTGKTMICKALAAAHPSLPFLYVRDIRERQGCNAQDAVKTIFTRARQLAPCILAFEDIDGMVGDARRTVFLNELDGFKDNDGLFVIASSNHPGKIDEALLKRPSRFDRVFHIGLPEPPERREFCRRVLRREGLGDRCAPDLDINGLSERVAAATDGFTPAYIKEALISAALVRAQSGAHLLDDAYAAEVMVQVTQLADYIRRSAKNPEAWADMRSSRDAVGFRA